MFNNGCTAYKHVTLSFNEYFDLLKYKWGGYVILTFDKWLVFYLFLGVIV